ncbi:hypothetical protein CALCODRAFT_521172 [Calocera cornea HHB12733]|uniref:F-box domain-containing protein n=1 Tax=Calocera cornea HHB12733 TaxID=1353952 RepID=A0A165CZD1_9BASI|nr:hypothetical protein CALCODRAFT_521172 [Calocera cornea HHB12733]
MPVETRSRVRALAAARSRNRSLHFASQAEADAYIIRKEIKELKKSRPTRLKLLTLTWLSACHDALQSPVYKLPDEVLRIILVLAFNGVRDNASGEDTSGEHEAMHYAIDLSHVTRRWRAVALSIPKLWAHIPVHPQLPMSALVSRMEALAMRSSPIVINATLDVGNLLHRFDETELRVISDVVCRKVYPRCERLKISGEFVWDTNSQTLAPGIFTFELAPRLRVLHMTDMEFTRSRSARFLLSLDSCIHLEELVLAACDFWLDDDDVVYKLRSLRRLTSLGDGSLKVVAHLDLPKVEHWTLGDHSCHHMDIAVFALLERDGTAVTAIRKHLPSLRRLTLQHCVIHMEPLARFFLKLLPVHMITCEDVFFTGRPTSAEGKPNSTARLPPADIAKLDFTECHGVCGFLDTLFTLTRPNSVLCRIHARGGSRMTPENQRRLRKHAVDVEWTPNPSQQATPLVLVPSSP